MKYEDFQKLITDEISGWATINFGTIGSGYLEILIVTGDEIISIGQLLYSCWRENSQLREMPSLLKELGQAAEEYRKGFTDKKPSLSYWDGKELRVSKGKANYLATVLHGETEILL